MQKLNDFRDLQAIGCNSLSVTAKNFDQKIIGDLLILQCVTVDIVCLRLFCVKYVRIQVFSCRIFLCEDRIVNFVLIREDKGHKPISWHTLRCDTNQKILESSRNFSNFFFSHRCIQNLVKN